MGRIAKSLLAAFRAQMSDLSQSAKQFTEGLPMNLPSPEELIDEGYDPQHILYISAQNFAALFAESVSELDEFSRFSETVELAENEYMPSAPPTSPITESFFWTWALFDLQFGADEETVGSCLLELLRSVQAPEEMLSAMENYSNSRMGVYEQCGTRGGEVRLRELVTGDELLCHSGSGYHGHEDELWYVRLAPPLRDEFDYHVAVTTPYVLTQTSTEDWTAFLNKHLLEARDRRLALHEFLKYGNERVNWMEFVFQAYHHFQLDAIFLAGIPDVPASLPHSPVHDEVENADNASELTMCVKLTEAQRKAIAGMCPELVSRLRLHEKNSRTVELQQGELKRVVAEAQRLLSNTKGPRRITLKKIIEIAEPPRRHATSQKLIYQFRITLMHFDPSIWRCVQCEDCTLADFHYVIQDAMGWENCHLHQFTVAGTRYAAPHPFAMGPAEFDDIDGSTVLLSQLIGGKKKFRCQYLYDFGDGWEHLVELEKVSEAEPKTRYPRCSGGERACPPEDCGGIGGFYAFVEAITDRKHPEHRDMLDWHHGPFKPDKFDKKKATRNMRR